MTKLSIIDEGLGNYVVDGDLTFATIDIKTLKSFGFLSSAKQITIDLGRVVCTDSAGLALMIEWIKYARQHRVQVAFKNIPEQLLNLAKLSGFDKTSHFSPQMKQGHDVESLPHTEII